MSAETVLREGQILTGPLFAEPMRVETARPSGSDTWVAGLVGLRSEQFRRVTLTSGDISGLTIADTALSYDGDGRPLRLGLQAYVLGIAYEFDPYFGLSISRVDPLPHQLEAVCEHLLKLPTVRFLLADDAGAGKTIMAGLLIRELKLRGLVERVLVVCPANLSFQWQRELKEKFDEKFLVLEGGDLRDQFGVNQWLEQRQIITSLDLAKCTDILPGLRQVHWDLVIVDEAHRMSARDESHKSQRYRLGELLRDSADHVLWRFGSEKGATASGASREETNGRVRCTRRPVPARLRPNNSPDSVCSDGSEALEIMTMHYDELIEEVRVNPDRLAAQRNYDICALYEDAKNRERAADRKVVKLAPRRLASTGGQGGGSGEIPADAKETESSHAGIRRGPD